MTRRQAEAIAGPSQAGPSQAGPSHTAPSRTYDGASSEASSDDVDVERAIAEDYRDEVLLLVLRVCAAGVACVCCAATRTLCL